MMIKKDDHKLRVVYIGGVEHNGSTFVGVTLGNHPQIECVGELTSLASQGWLGVEYCACGLSINDCDFWNGVKDEWTRLSGAEITSLAEAEEAYDRHRRLPKTISQRYFRSQNFVKYCEYTIALFDAVRKTSGNSIIVDTSKRYSRAVALSMVPGIDLRVVHLIRDSRGVAYSWSKPIRPRKRSWFDSSLRWNTNNMAFEYVKRRIEAGRVLRIRYEDLLSNPVEFFGELGRFIDMDLTSIGEKLSAGESLEKNHVGVGNGFLHRVDEVKLRPLIEWPQKIPLEIQHKVWKFTWPLMQRYGYKF